MSKTLCLCTALFVALGGEASAHAMLKSARPGVGSTYATAPRAIELEFSEGVVPSFSSIALRDDAGHAVHLGRLAKGASATILVVPIVDPLPAGAYKVTWHAVSVDTHRTQGSFGFTVAR